VLSDQLQPRIRPVHDVNSGPRAYRLPATFDPHLVVAGRDPDIEKDERQAGVGFECDSTGPISVVM
jgi:hypothetical protein